MSNLWPVCGNNERLHVCVCVCVCAYIQRLSLSACFMYVVLGRVRRRNVCIQRAASLNMPMSTLTGGVY